MLLSDEHKLRIEELAGLFFTPVQIAIMLDLDVKQFVASCGVENSEAYRAFWKGYFEADMEYRKSVKRLSTLDSSPAQTLLAKLIEKQDLDHNNR